MNRDGLAVIFWKLIIVFSNKAHAPLYKPARGREESSPRKTVFIGKGMLGSFNNNYWSCVWNAQKRYTINSLCPRRTQNISGLCKLAFDISEFSSLRVFETFSSAPNTTSSTPSPEPEVLFNNFDQLIHIGHGDMTDMVVA